MTPAQLTLDDLADRGAELLEDPADPEWRDLRGQNLTADQYHRMTSIDVRREWL